MTWSQFKYLVQADFYRLSGQIGSAALVKEIFFGGSFKYVFWMRSCAFLRKRWLLRYTLYPFARFMLGRLVYKLGISIPYRTQIGSGLYIGHFGGIFVSSRSVIGKNCNLSQGVTLGRANRGSRKGAPTLGDNVYVGPGAKIVGAVRIGDDVAIGANCVVTRDVPDHSVVVGIPGRVISDEGSGGYVVWTDYDRKLHEPR